MLAIEMVQGDTAPRLRATLTDGLTKAPVDLSACTTRIMVGLANGSGATTTIIGTLPNGGTDGVVEFAWPVGTFAVAGMYDAQVEITYSNGLVETIPHGSISVVEKRD